MFIDEEGKVVSCDGSCPEVIGRHWVYCCYGTSYGKLYSYSGLYWYKFGRDESVDIGQDKINALPCSVWEMFHTNRLLDDIGFVKTFRGCIAITDFIDAGIKESELLEGLLA